MFRSTGRRSLTWPEKLVLSVSEGARRWLLPKVRLTESGFQSIYVCNSKADAQRPLSLWLKEEGTMRWIDSEIRTGSVFMDIGANIGVYTIAAAHRVGPNGRVYAFEPHKVNATTLMQNVMLSGLADRIDIFACPLSDETGVLRFNYASLASASSGSQLGHTRVPGKPAEFAPVASELVPSVTVDALIEKGVISPPALVKIDVDGNELAILRGMRSLLTGQRKPTAIQVEINVGQRDLIGAFMADCAYRLDATHLTRPGEVKRSRGVPLDQIEHNAIFRSA